MNELGFFVLALALLFAGFFAGIYFDRWTGDSPLLQTKRPDRAWKGRRRGRPAAMGFPGVDAADQLRVVMAASFDRRALLNKKEARVLYAAEKAVKDVAQGWRVMAQVCLGEILSCHDKAAFAAINSKRVDLLVIDRAGNPLAAIEYQGAGHYQGTAAARDAVKKEALRKAGVRYIEISQGDEPDDLRREILRIAKIEDLRPAA